MSRPPRIEIANGIFHVVARGNERKPIYRDAADRERFLELLELAVKRYRWRVLCYCLMSNHYHLLVTTPEPNLARGMRELNGVYAQSFNRRHCRGGHLFQGRYKALLVQADEHLLASVRYIIRNPLRAGLCEQVAAWQWTSHQATIGARPAGFLASDELLSYLAPTRSAACLRYSALVEADCDLPGPAHPIVDGDDSFISSHLERVQPSPEHPRAHITPPRPPLHAIVTSQLDSAAIVHAHRDHGYSMRQIATHLDCGLTTIHRRIRAEETSQA